MNGDAGIGAGIAGLVLVGPLLTALETVLDRKLAILTVPFAVVGYAIAQTDRAHVAFAKFPKRTAVQRRF